MTPGFHTMPSAAYHADPAPLPSLSSHLAQILVRESPRKAWFSHPRLNKAYKEKHDTKFDLGTAAHSVLLENDASKIVIVEADDWRSKAAKEAREAAYAASRTPLLARHYDAVRDMVDTALAFIAESEIGDLWHEGESELVGICEEPDVWLRARLDRITLDRRYVFDYKTTDNPAPEVFSRQIARMGYHFQDAFYRRVVRNITGAEPKFVFLAQSVEPPYECALFGCDPALCEIADAEVELAIQRWRDCLLADDWPTYSGRIHWVMPTTYQMNEYEMRLQEAA